MKEEEGKIVCAQCNWEKSKERERLACEMHDVPRCVKKEAKDENEKMKEDENCVKYFLAKREKNQKGIFWYKKNFLTKNFVTRII